MPSLFKLNLALPLEVYKMKNPALKIITAITSAIAFTGLVSSFSITANAAPANSSSSDGVACSTTGDMIQTGDNCRATPSTYQISIYELGVCTEHPYGTNRLNPTFNTAACKIVYTDASPAVVDIVDTIGGSLKLGGTSTMPPNGVYKYPYMVMNNSFITAGSFTDSNGITYSSKSDGSLNNDGTTAAARTETLDNFGGPNCFSGYIDASVSAGTMDGFIADNDLARSDVSEATSQKCDKRTRLVGVMNLTTPFTITSDTKVFQFNFILTNYGVQFIDTNSGPAIPEEFSSAPFSGSFTVSE